MRDENNILHFTTQSGIAYFATFLSSSHFSAFPALDSLLYEFSFDFMGTGNPPVRHDPKVGNTVVALAFRFLKQFPDGVLMFVCDPTDARNRQRKILFSKWFRTHGQAEFEKLDVKVVDESHHYYASLIFRQNHPYAAEIVAAVEGTRDLYQSFK